MFSKLNAKSGTFLYLKTEFRRSYVLALSTNFNVVTPMLPILAKLNVFQDLSTKIIKVNSDIFAEVIHKDLNKGLEKANFSYTIKFMKKTTNQRKMIIDLSTYCQTY